MDWDNDFDAETHEYAGSCVLQEFATFIQESNHQLRDVEEAIGYMKFGGWDAVTNPITVKADGLDTCGLHALVEMDNIVLSKVVCALAALCHEVKLLGKEAKDKYYPTLLFYGEDCVAVNKDGSVQMMMGRMLPSLQRLAGFVHRCYDVVHNIVQQLDIINTKTSNLHKSDFMTVFYHLSELLAILMTLDAIMESQQSLSEHWSIYKCTIVAAQQDPAKYNTDKPKLKSLEGILSKLDSAVMDNNIFQNCMQQKFPASVGDMIAHGIRCMVHIIEGSVSDTWCNQSSHVVGVTALTVLHYYISKQTDKKLIKLVWDLHKKVAVVPLCGTAYLFIDRFLASHLPPALSALDKKAAQNAQSSHSNHLTTKVAQLTKDINNTQTQVAQWSIQMESMVSADMNKLNLEDMNTRCNLLLQGVLFGENINTLVRTVICLHVGLNKSMSKSTVLCCIRLVTLLKSILMLHQRVKSATMVIHIQQHLLYLIMTLISNVKKRVFNEKKYSDSRLDVLSALVVSEKCLNAPPTPARLLVTKLALGIANQGRTFTADEVSNLYLLLHKLCSICNIDTAMIEACDTTYMYWQREILPLYLHDLYTNHQDYTSLQHLFNALSDCTAGMLAAEGADSQPLIHKYQTQIWDYIKDKVIDPFCRDMETELRLLTHTHLIVGERNPFKTGVKHVTSLVNQHPYMFFSQYLNIKGYTEQYLEKNFYNLTTVALHDWKTYGLMRSNARDKFHLHITEDHLPSQTLEQGLDVLEIMRNIDIFVSRYSYNLNNQVFVEKNSNNKHVNTIHIRHVANSIRTHGAGIMNTTVNFTYQFLRKKFYIFSQFLFDDHIKSRLIKDVCWLRESKVDSVDLKYPYERAERFNRGIRKLGVSKDGLTYLDQFRLLITHIGNAMGYIRMIRSGGLSCCSAAIRFIPDLDDIVEFTELCSSAGLSDSCTAAAKQLDHVIADMIQNFSDGTEYFKLLVEVFSSVMRGGSHAHLRNFYIVLPPLTLNYIEHSLRAKDTLNKKNKQGAAFTDDGFAMGVAYILKLLSQYGEFDSLHWFECTREYFSNKASATNDTSLRNDEKLQQTVSLTLKRLQQYQQEFDLLYYSLSSARIFFKADHVSLLSA